MSGSKRRKTAMTKQLLVFTVEVLIDREFSIFLHQAADGVVFGMIPEMWLLPIRILSVELLKNC